MKRVYIKEAVIMQNLICLPASQRGEPVGGYAALTLRNSGKSEYFIF
ncbi:MAG: hypothetical protein WC575_02595 [Patescibacteria group bacterium]